jgi:hypothetical protein
LAGRLFEEIKIKDTLQDMIKRCEICQPNNLHNTAYLSLELRGEGWQLDFIHLPGGPPPERSWFW